MEFRYPSAAAATKSSALEYLIEGLHSPEKGKVTFEDLLKELGNVIDDYPEWHPILTLPSQPSGEHVTSLSQLETYRGIDHTIMFVRGFVTCPYSEHKANTLVDSVNSVDGLHAYRLDDRLYSDSAYPVVVSASQIQLEADGTIRGRDALAWCTQELVRNAHKAEVAETWWNMRPYILGCPHGSRSSLVVNQHTGGHMRKILETLNNSGMYGPIKEWSLDMLSEKKRKIIAETLLRAAINNRKSDECSFEFELRGETCKAEIRDTWRDGEELSIRVSIGNHDLYVTGFFYPGKNILQSSDPNGKRAIAEKFL